MQLPSGQIQKQQAPRPPPPDWLRSTPRLSLHRGAVSTSAPPCRLRSPHVKSCPRPRLRFIPAVLQLGLLLRDLLTCAPLRRPRARIVSFLTKQNFVLLRTTESPQQQINLARVTAVGVWASTAQPTSVPIRQPEPSTILPPQSHTAPALAATLRASPTPSGYRRQTKTRSHPTGFVPRVLPASGYRRLKTYAVSCSALHRPRFCAPPTKQKSGGFCFVEQ